MIPVLLSTGKNAKEEKDNSLLHVVVRNLLEPCAVKVACTVLRRVRGSNALYLSDVRRESRSYT